jgi:hypothetical protein
MTAHVRRNGWGYGGLAWLATISLLASLGILSDSQFQIASRLVLFPAAIVIGQQLDRGQVNRAKKGKRTSEARGSHSPKKNAKGKVVRILLFAVFVVVLNEFITRTVLIAVSQPVL